MTTLEFGPLHPSLAAQVVGFDPERGFARDDVTAIKAALSQFAVLVIRATPLTDGQLVSFGAAFGELELLPEPEKRDPEHPEIFNLSNVRPDGDLTEFEEPQAVFLRGTERWHTDSSYRESPCLASILHAREIPQQGGSTQFANMVAAYEALDDEHRQSLAGRRVIHSYEYSRSMNPGRMEPMDDAERAKFPPVVHPLVRRHADGSKSLYMGAHASHIEGEPTDVGRAMLSDLLDEATQDAFIYEHYWSVGDTVVWDNRRTLHRLRPYPIQRERRVMRRLTVADAAPVF